MSRSALRVLMLLENCPYPQDIRVRLEAETLAAAGHRVTVICPRAAGQPWREERNGVRLFRFPYPQARRGLLSYLIEFTYALAVFSLGVLWCWGRDGIDVIHLHNPPDMLFLATVLPRLWGKRIIFDHHDLSAEIYQAKVTAPKAWVCHLLHRLERWSCRFADRVITVNESYRHRDITRNRVDPERICVVRNGPDLREFPASDLCEPPNAHEPIRIGYIGYIGRQDGIDDLLLALRHLKDNLGYRNWTCQIVGPAEEPQRLQQLIADLGLADWVEWTGHKPHSEALRLLSAMDIGAAPEQANPLNDQSTMIKVLEYMAAGKPVVAYDLTEHRVSAADAALYARPNQPDDLACQIARLLDDADLRTRLGTTGRRRIEQELAWCFSAERLLACYRALAEMV